MDVEPFLRGVVWLVGSGVAYPRADPTDWRRLPADTWAAAQLPAGVRLEMTASATQIDVGYLTATDELGYRGPGAGASFSAWRGTTFVDEQPARLGRGTVRFAVGAGTDRVVIYLPEGMRPVITSIRAVNGEIHPGTPRPRWIAYGDSITEGWVASAPAATWLAIAGRELDLDTVNLGYAGSARGEIVSAEHVSAHDSRVISLAFGTNCWSMIPHSPEMLHAVTQSFLRIIRSSQPHVPIVVLSPILRPDAERRPNRLGATLADLRSAMENAVTDRADRLTVLVPGRDLLNDDQLEDGIHPGDAGHRRLAEVMGNAVQEALKLTTILGPDAVR